MFSVKYNIKCIIIFSLLIQDNFEKLSRRIKYSNISNFCQNSFVCIEYFFLKIK